MRYEGMIYRPPSEAYSYLLQVTVGCSHNKCTFCSMYKDKKFHVRPMADIMEDLDMARGYYDRVGRIFLCDGDALCLANSKLLAILNRIAELFPECERVTTYGRASDINRKTDEELIELREAGLAMVYMGAESGSDEVLKRINKGSTREEIIAAVKKVERCGIMASVTFISGLGGRELMREHAIKTGSMITEMGASYVGLLTLMTEPLAPLTGAIARGEFQVLTGEEAVAETLLILQNVGIPAKSCVFRMNHASNYLSLRGNLPEDRDRMIARCEAALQDTGMLKSEIFRAL
ncbi:MAG: B12-binding domain-containing radical SAM protein [Firmicutes bacterium]|nr:B12-binding domain-containing radical SAM protein [Bacillota bacterium]